MCGWDTVLISQADARPVIFSPRPENRAMGQTWKRRLHNFVSNRAANHCWWSWRTACQSVLLPFTFSNSTSKAQKTAWKKKKRSGIFPDGGCCVSNKPSSSLTSVTFYRFHIRRTVASHRNMLLSEGGAVWRVSNRLYFMARDVLFLPPARTCRKKSRSDAQSGFDRKILMELLAWTQAA